MAHSTAAATTSTTGEINYFFQGENGKILKVLKQAEIKQEPIETTSTAYPNANSNMTAYSQIQSSSNQPQFERMHNSYNIQPSDKTTTYTIITQQSGSSSGGSRNVQQHQQQQHAVSTIKYKIASDGNYNGARSTANTKLSSEERYGGKYTQNTSKLKSKMHTTNSTNASVQRKRKPEKAGKGLRHFSMKVCEKVKEKGTTTYNEVADELVAEEIINNTFDSANCDQKNIRRRVYDALNVLMAMQIISKDKKEIRWIGLPSNSHVQCSALEKENEERRERIKQKHQQLRELLLHQVSFKSLIERNKDAERQGIIPTPNSSIQLPFIIVNTHKSTKINCSVTNDKSEYIFKFDDKFEMHDDGEVLKRMGLLSGLDQGQCTYEDIERAKMLVPPNFEKYIEAYGSGQVPCDESDNDDDDIPTSYIELTNDSQIGFERASDCGGGGGVRVDVAGVLGGGSGSKTPEYDDDETYLDNSDID